MISNTRNHAKAALEKLQSDRKAARLYMEAVEEETSDEWETTAFGFEFSNDEIERRAIAMKPDLFDTWCRKHPEELAV